MNATETTPLDELLDGVQQELATHPTRALARLFRDLLTLRARATPVEWRRIVATAIAHPLKNAIHEDPMTKRSFEKPRGYAGDAVLLDYIYMLSDATGATPTGRAVNRYAVARPAARAVRWRREVIASRLDAIDDGTRQKRVLSVACGHLREASFSRAVSDGAIAPFFALDADATSLEVAAEVGETIAPIQMSIRDVLAGKPLPDDLDFAYSAGLYDYLTSRAAKRLTAELFARLAPGGRLLISNFTTRVADAGFMETFMGWDLLLRDRAAILGFAAEVPRESVASCRYFDDPFEAIGYLELERTA